MFITKEPDILKSYRILRGILPSMIKIANSNIVDGQASRLLGGVIANLELSISYLRPQVKIANEKYLNSRKEERLRAKGGVNAERTI